MNFGCVRVGITGERKMCNIQGNQELTTKYVKVKQIGYGCYGDVFKAFDRAAGKYVALKQLKRLGLCEGDEVPYWVKREISVLKSLKHRNIINLMDVCRIPGIHHIPDHHLVFELCEYDLLNLISNPELTIMTCDIKLLMGQIFTGINHLHSMDILHRDLKPENILINKEGVVKIADFGLSRLINQGEDDERLTSTVVSLWYRPPELLLGATQYGQEIDIWSAGCMMAQLFTREVTMRASTEQGLLMKISEICGSISPEVWPEVVELDLYGQFALPKNQSRKVIEVLGPKINCPSALRLIDKMLTIDPHYRPCSLSVLESDFLRHPPIRGDLCALLLAHEESKTDDLAPLMKKSRTRRAKKRKRCQEPEALAVSAVTVLEI